MRVSSQYIKFSINHLSPTFVIIVNIADIRTPSHLISTYRLAMDIKLVPIRMQQHLATSHFAPCNILTQSACTLHPMVHNKREEKNKNQKLPMGISALCQQWTRSIIRCWWSINTKSNQQHTRGRDSLPSLPPHLVSGRHIRSCGMCINQLGGEDRQVEVKGEGGI